MATASSPSCTHTYPLTEYRHLQRRELPSAELLAPLVLAYCAYQMEPAAHNVELLQTQVNPSKGMLCDVLMEGYVT